MFAGRETHHRPSHGSAGLTQQEQGSNPTMITPTFVDLSNQDDDEDFETPMTSMTFTTPLSEDVVDDDEEDEDDEDIIRRLVGTCDFTIVGIRYAIIVEKHRWVDAEHFPLKL